MLLLKNLIFRAFLSHGFAFSCLAFLSLFAPPLFDPTAAQVGFYVTLREPSSLERPHMKTEWGE